MSGQISLQDYENFDPTYAWEIAGRRIVYCTPNRASQWRAETLFQKEPCTIEWLQAFHEGATFLDVGANVGMYSIFAAVVRSARVYAFEPESQNYALLNRNIFANRLGSRITALCAGLSDREGVDTLFLSQFSTGASCHSLADEVDFNLQARPAAFSQGCVSMTLDRLIETGNMPTPEYIKVDVDGFEHRVIRGARRTLGDERVKGVLIELNPRLDDHLDVIELLCECGFDYDPAQVERAVRRDGPFEGIAEYVFRR